MIQLSMIPSIWTTTPRPRLPVALLLSMAVLAPAAFSAQLARVVPEESFMMSHRVADESMGFVDEYNAEVLAAVHDARFDELVIEVLESGGLSSELGAQLRTLRDVMATLIHRVDWAALTERESVFCMDMRPMVPWIPGLPSVAMAFSTDAKDVAGLESSLKNLLATVAAISPDYLAFETIAHEDTGSTLFNLRARQWNDLPVLQMAVRGNEILFAMGEGLFQSSLSLMEGRGGMSLVDTPRFATSFGELSRTAPQSTFIDVAQLIDDAQMQVMPFIGDDYNNKMERDMAREFFDLGRVIDTVAYTVHAEELTVVGETWVRFDDQAVANGNPIYQALASPASNDLLAFVPADATSFSATKGFDLVPLYRWGLDMYQRYGDEREVEQALVSWKSLQAVLDLDFETDVLAVMASDSIKIQLPSSVAGGMGEDFVVLTKAKNPEALRSIIRRTENVYAAAVPWLMKEIKEKEPNMPLPSIKISDARGMFPGMKRINASMRLPMMSIPIPEVTYGMVGDMLVFTNSEPALATVMETGAGEVDGIEDHPALLSGNRLTDNPMAFASLTPFGMRLAETQTAFQMVSGGLNFMLLAATENSDKAEVKTMVKAMAGMMPRVGSIISHLDFLEDGVSYSQLSEVHSAMYCRNSIRYLAQNERH